MKISKNIKLIERNKKIAQFTLYGSLALLSLGFIWTLRNPEPSKSYIGYLILIPAYLLVQLSIYMANRWGKSPRPDEMVAQSLKGLDDRFTLYSYTTDVPNLLVGPIGVCILNPYRQSGEISYDVEKAYYKQKGGGNFIVRYFSQEALPNVSRDGANQRKDLLAYFAKKSIQFDEEIIVINIFFSDKVVLNTNGAPGPNIKADKLKDYVRKNIKTARASIERIEKLQKELPQPEQ